MSAKHIHITIERYSFIQPNGDIEEYVAYALQNNGSTPHPLSGKHFHHGLTDSENTVLMASDGLSGFLDPHGGCEFATMPNGVFLVALNLRGHIAPGKARIVGVHVRRRKLANAQPNEANLDDPLTRREFSAFPDARIEAVVVYVFPVDPIRREISATGAILKTTRLVRWEYTPHPNILERWRARALDAILPPATFSIDDAIAEFYRVFAADAAGTVHEPAEAIRLLEELPESFANATIEARQFLIQYRTYPFEERQIRARQLVTTLHSLRDRITVTPMPLGAKHLDVLRFTIQDVRNKIDEHGILSPPPRSLQTVVSHLLRFADSCRQGSPFGKNVREKDFHQRLLTFLQGANGPVQSEVTMGQGRIDLVLDDTPIELKAKKLGKNPAQGITRHFEQAASYASGRTVAAGVLVILDLTNHTHETQHSAPLSSNIKVVPVKTKKTIRGTNHTVLVVLVIEAFPPTPSSLGVKGKRNPSARRTGTRASSSPRGRSKPARRGQGETSRV
ncbi:hypothetical protein JRI60_33175 [Archangium violaceum]|uniref:hypothetical protein n=1 Tax=Archangium violaceum TaxID=83451 RepID=UPI00195115DE|nr:hypothetical protein [Archangium violaceum]QRN93986.1 hypothetical protein JRI60_33175 [Archangium violaceum]